MGGILDLSQASDDQFDALPSDTYSATVFKVEMKQTKGGEGSKLPAGTDMFNVQFRLDENSGYENRRVFKAFVVAPATIDGQPYEHKAKMDGILVRFFEAIGYSEEEVKSGSFNPDLSDMEGRPCRVVVRKKQKYNTKPEDDEWDNEVTGVKPPSQTEAGIL